jgi:two-component system, OmpR family, response regulator
MQHQNEMGRVEGRGFPEVSERTRMSEAVQQPLHVFLVEDSPIIRERLTESLSTPGRIEVVGHADTEHGAVAALKSTEWDVLVLDLQLKQGTGLGVLKALAGAKPQGAKVIVLTNYAIPQFRDRSVALGADFFFDKSREYYRVKSVLEDLAATRDGHTH